MSFNWSNAAEVAIATGLGEIPGVGSILAGLVAIFWPESQEDIWAEIKDKVEAVVGKAIDSNVYTTVQEKLGTVQQQSGLIGVLDIYLTAVRTNEHPGGRMRDADDVFIKSSADFEAQGSGYEVMLLPLFAQMANMHLTLLRDGIVKGYCEATELNDPTVGRLPIYTNWASQQTQNGVTQRAAANPNSYNYQNESSGLCNCLLVISVNFGPTSTRPSTPTVQKICPPSTEIFYTVTEAVGPQFSSDNYAPRVGKQATLPALGSIVCRTAMTTTTSSRARR